MIITYTDLKGREFDYRVDDVSEEVVAYVEYFLKEKLTEEQKVGAKKILDFLINNEYLDELIEKSDDFLETVKSRNEKEAFDRW